MLNIFIPDKSMMDYEKELIEKELIEDKEWRATLFLQNLYNLWKFKK